jgi:cysteine desulfurase/selenocysteine lyase
MPDWRDEWSDFGGVTYLDTAAEGVMPRVAVQAAQHALELKAHPYRFAITAQSYVELPNRLRAALASLVGGSPDEIALTTGASAGAIALALCLPWKAGDEVVTAAGEFPLQYTTWAPLAARDGVALRVAAPSGALLSTDDLIAALTPKTRLVSVSLVRFDDGSLLNVRPLVEACRAQGTLVCLDVSQCCGAVPIDVQALGVDFLTCAGYKWLLGPYGTGFFWVRREHLALLRPAPFYWMATEGADDFGALRFDDPRPAPSARRFDTPEWAGAYNPNLAGATAAVELVARIGPTIVRAHNARLVDRMIAGLPETGAALVSPTRAADRGPFGCFRAATVDRTKALHQRLVNERVFVSFRQGNIRVAPYLFNTDADIDRLLGVLDEPAAGP